MTDYAPPTEGVGTPPAYGMCTACGAIETGLIRIDGYRDLSSIGEHPRYPFGHGCELCS